MPLVLLASCASPEQPGTAGRVIRVSSELAQQQVVQRQLLADPETIDPALATGVPSQHVLDDLFEGLVGVGEDGGNVPGVAASWDTSADGKTWTFHLREDARWSNGQPVTAQDFVYAWRRQVDPATGSQYAEALTPIENADAISNGKMPAAALGVEALGPRTLLVHLNSPTPYFLALLTNQYLDPLYEPAVKQWGEAWTQPGHMVSNGAFMLTERVVNGHITLLKNPYYWDAKSVKLSQVVYHPIEDNSAAQDQFLAGDLDITNTFNVSQIDWLRRTLGSQVMLSPYFGTALFAFNMTKPPFENNPKLRLALSMALDRKILAKDVERGTVLPAYNLVPPLEGYDPAIPDWARLSDQDRHALARKLYREAGYSDAHPLATTLTYPSGGASVRRYMEAMAAMWQINLGAHVEIYNMEWKVLLQSRSMKEPVLFWDAWIGDYPDPLTFMQLFQTGLGQNDGGYSDPQFDALANQAASTTDVQQHFQLFRQAETILNQDVPYLPLYFYESPHLIKPYLKGWKTNVSDRNLSKYMYVLEHQETAS